MSNIRKTALLAAVFCLAFSSCDKVNKLSDQTSVESFQVSGIAPEGITVEEVRIEPTPDNPKGNKIIIKTDASRSDYLWQYLPTRYFQANRKYFTNLLACQEIPNLYNGHSWNRWYSATATNTSSAWWPRADW